MTAVALAFAAGLLIALVAPGCWFHGGGGSCGDPLPLSERSLDDCGVWVAPNVFDYLADEPLPDVVATMTTTRDRVVFTYEQDGEPVEVVYRVE